MSSHHESSASPAKLLLAIGPVFALSYSPATPFVAVITAILCAVPAIVVDLCIQWYLAPQQNQIPGATAQSLHALHFPLLAAIPLGTFAVSRALAS